MAITEKYTSSAGAGAHDGSSEANAFSWAEMITDINATGKAGNRYNVIRGGGVIARTTTTDTISSGGSATSPVIIRGYTTTITDGYQGRTNSNGPLITTTFCQITYTTGTLNVTGTFILFECLEITGARNGNSVLLSADDYFSRCRVANAAAGASGACISLNAARATAFDCDFALSNGGNAGTAAILIGSVCRVIGGRVTSTAAGISIAASSGFVVAFPTIYSATGNSIALTNTGAYGTIINPTIVSGGADGINVITASTVSNFFLNPMITDCTGDGIDMVSTGNAAIVAYRRTRSNANGLANAGDWITATDYGAVTTTGAASTDYTNAGGNDYSLVSSSPATSAGIPYAASIGALQRLQTGGGAATPTSYTF